MIRAFIDERVLALWFTQAVVVDLPPSTRVAYGFEIDMDVLEGVLARVLAEGGQVTYAKKQVGFFWVAEFEDSEGNLIALSAADE